MAEYFKFRSASHVIYYLLSPAAGFARSHARSSRKDGCGTASL